VRARSTVIQIERAAVSNNHVVVIGSIDQCVVDSLKHFAHASPCCLKKTNGGSATPHIKCPRNISSVGGVVRFLDSVATIA
jgi:hypothetical protein